jgi:hypothetical protein
VGVSLLDNDKDSYGIIRKLLDSIFSYRENQNWHIKDTVEHVGFIIS